MDDNGTGYLLAQGLLVICYIVTYKFVEVGNLVKVRKAISYCCVLMMCNGTLNVYIKNLTGP